MTDSIRGMGACPDAGADVDAYLREATGARADASATRHAEGHDPSHGIHAGVDAAGFAMDVVGAAAHHGSALAFGLEVAGSANDAGTNAVYGGEDLSPESAERYESDLAFQHGVDAARVLRDTDPVAYEAARREASTLHTSVMDGRSGPVRG